MIQKYLTAMCKGRLGQLSFFQQKYESKYELLVAISNDAKD